VRVRSKAASGGTKARAEVRGVKGVNRVRCVVLPLASDYRQAGSCQHLVFEQLRWARMHSHLMMSASPFCRRLGFDLLDIEL
jgi:hypothetical protein